MKENKKDRKYRIAIFPMIVCLSMLWSGLMVIFLVARLIKHNEITEMMGFGIIALFPICLFIKYMIKVIVSEKGIIGQGSDNKHYFVAWDEMERIELKRFVNLRYIVVYFNVHAQSIYIPLFLSRKKELVKEILQKAPTNNMLRKHFEYGIDKGSRYPWGKTIDKEILLKQREGFEQVFKGSVSFFYIIAISSVVTIYINIYRNKNAIYIMGLGITKIINNYATMFLDKFSNAYKVSIIINILIAFSFIFLGEHARKRRKWSFTIGIIIYGIDILLLLAVKEYVAGVFHGFLLVCLSLGIPYGDLLTEIEEELEF